MSAYNTFGNDAIGDDDPEGEAYQRDADRDRESEWQNATSDGELERKARPEDGPEYSFWKGIKVDIDPLHRANRRRQR